MVSSSDFIALALRAVKELVPVVLSGATRTDKAVVTKRDGSLVTEIDQQVETRLVKGFNEAFPGVPVLGEEGAIDSQAKSAEEMYGGFLQASHQIIIDPIDGTKNFIQGRPQYCIAVALSKRFASGVWPVAGVIAIPEEQRLYWADEQSLFVEDMVTGVQGPVELAGEVNSSVSVNSRDRSWLAERRIELLTPWVSSGSSVYDFLGSALGRTRASIIGSQRLWDLMAPLAIALRAGLVLRDLQTGDELHSLHLSDLSDDIDSRPWGLGRKMVLSMPDLKLSQVVATRA